MAYRVENSHLSSKKPSIPLSFFYGVIKRDDPGYKFRYSNEGIPNSLKEKRILVLSGADDPLVPWSISKGFIEDLQQVSRLLQVKLYPGVGHEYTAEMKFDLKEYVLKHCL